MPQNDRIRRAYCTTREAAQMLGVSLRTAQLWTESGLLEAWKTEGGHRRISRTSVERLLSSPAIDNPFRADEVTPTVDLTDKSATTNPFSILIVDDEATLCLVYQMTMARWSMKPEVDTAYDGYEALIRIGLGRPDMLVTDLRMPGLDGFRMIHTLRSQPELADMAIVVVTGLSPDEIESGGGIPDGIPVLPKPIPFEQLHEIACGIAADRGVAKAPKNTIERKSN